VTGPPASRKFSCDLFLYLLPSGDYLSRHLRSRKFTLKCLRHCDQLHTTEVYSQTTVLPQGCPRVTCECGLGLIGLCTICQEISDDGNEAWTASQNVHRRASEKLYRETVNLLLHQSLSVSRCSPHPTFCSSFVLSHTFYCRVKDRIVIYNLSLIARILGFSCPQPVRQIYQFKFQSNPTVYLPPWQTLMRMLRRRRSSLMSKKRMAMKRCVSRYSSYPKAGQANHDHFTGGYHGYEKTCGGNGSGGRKTPPDAS
jgi:hypothetical protein